MNSDRPGPLGSNLWVAHRTSHKSPFGSAVNLGPPIDSPFDDGGANVSADGHLLFFNSDRLTPGVQTDVYVAHRDDTHDDFAWETPVHLGPPVSSAEDEFNTVPAQGPQCQGVGLKAKYLAVAGKCLYFVRSPFPTDLYVVALDRHGVGLGHAVKLKELSDPQDFEFQPTIRGDGRELYFIRADAVSFGVWVSTREKVSDPWGAPVAADALFKAPRPIDSVFLSLDGTTAIIGLVDDAGLTDDLYISTRIQNLPHDDE